MLDGGFGGTGYRGEKKGKSITVANEQSKDKGSDGDPSSAHTPKEGKKKGKEVKMSGLEDVRRKPL